MPPVIDEDYVRALREKLKNSKKRKAAEAAAAAASAESTPVAGGTGADEGDGRGKTPRLELPPAAKEAGEALPASGESSTPSTGVDVVTEKPAVVVDAAPAEEDDGREEGEISDEDGPPAPSPPPPTAALPLAPLPPAFPSPHPQHVAADPYGPHGYSAHMIAAMREALIGAERFPPMSAQLEAAIKEGTIGRKGRGRGKEKEVKKQEAETKAVAEVPAVKAYDPVAIGTQALKITEQEYRATRILLLELISWGVEPEQFVHPLGLSRDAILLYFRDLRIRLPSNLPKGTGRNRKMEKAPSTEPVVKEEEVEEGEEEEGEVTEDGEMAEDSVKPGVRHVEPAAAPETEPTTPAPPVPTQEISNAVASSSTQQASYGHIPHPHASTPVAPLPVAASSHFTHSPVFLPQHHPQMYHQPFFYPGMEFGPPMRYTTQYSPWLQQPLASSDVNLPLPPTTPAESTSSTPALPSQSPLASPALPATEAAPAPASAPAAQFTASSTRLVRKQPAKRPTALDLDQPPSLSGSVSPAVSDTQAVYVPLSASAASASAAAAVAVKQLVADHHHPRRFVIDISDEEDEADDDDVDMEDGNARPSSSTLASARLKVDAPPSNGSRSKSATPASDSLEAKESEIQRMMALISAMEKKQQQQQKTRSPSLPRSKVPSPVVATTSLPEPPAPSF